MNAVAAQIRADGGGRPHGGLRQRVRRVKFVFRGDRRQDRRAPGGEERRSEHQHRAEHVEQRVVLAVHTKHETKRNNEPQQIAGDHHALAVETVKSHTGKRPGNDGGQRAGDHDAGHGQPGTGVRKGQAEHRDVVEVVADFRNNLAHPRVAAVGVGSENLKEADGSHYPIVA